MACGVLEMRVLEGRRTMDEPSGDNSQAATGNVAIPEWMLKRRALQTGAASLNHEENSAVPHTLAPETLKSDIASNRPEVEITKGVETPRRAPPAWFRSKKPGAVAAGATKPSAQVQTAVLATGIALPPIAVDEPESLEWHEELRERWLGKAALRSFAISIFMHILVALPLSLLVFRQEITDYGLSTLLAVQEEEATGDVLDETPAFQLDTSGGSTGESLDSILTARSVSNDLGLSTLKVPDDVGGLSKGEGDGVGDQIGNSLGGYKMPAGGKAVSKGSFTAWTVPDDPAPGEDYKIVIQVKYTKKSQKIPSGDITGSVIGTDKYRLMITPRTSEVIAEANQVVIFVPGAAARVRDTIRVYSAMLKENQRIEIVF